MLTLNSIIALYIYFNYKMYICIKIMSKMDLRSGEYTVVVKNTLESTNSFAKALLTQDKNIDRTVIFAKKQTKGRGQDTNKWESADGKNLTFSIMYFPKGMFVSQQFYISRAIALGVADYLSGKVNNVSIKWPNDIYVGENKIAGILIENTVKGANISSVICGVGININQEKFISDAPNPVSLKQLTGEEYSLEDELTVLLQCIENRYALLENYELDLLDKDYNYMLFKKLGYHMFNEKGVIFKARIHSITEIGQMVLEKEDGNKKTYNFKEVSYVI